MTKLQTLQKLQNRAARIVTKSNFDTPSIDLIQSLNWPTVSDIIRGETATLRTSFHQEHILIFPLCCNLISFFRLDRND